MRWDIFCRVIDNHGDIGVCWRLAAELASRGHQARLWVDDPSALAWMAPGGHPGVQVVHWTADATAEPLDAVIEAFGCDPPPAFVAAMAARARLTARQPAWINLEYLSAERYVERSHGLPSPVLQGPGQGLVKQFVYPGFTSRTGGLLRERDLARRQAAFDRDAWLHRFGIPAGGAQLASLFCYEPHGLPGLLRAWADGTKPIRLLVTHGRARAAVEAAGWSAGQHGRLAVQWLPLLSQEDFDHLLWSCDLNFVRGEDSWVRALWAGRPFVWQAYPQSDGAHHPKVQAFLDWQDPPASLRHACLCWNGMAGPATMPWAWEPSWGPAALQARDKALALPELATTVEQFADVRGTI